jgi:hypothetical protein
MIRLCQVPSLPPTPMRPRLVFDPPLLVLPGESIAQALQRQPQVTMSEAA